MFKKPSAASIACQPRQYTRIGCGIDYPINRGKSGDIAGCAQVSVYEFHAKSLKPGPVRFRAGTHQVIHARQVNTFGAFKQQFSESASNEATNSRDENPHAGPSARPRFHLIAAALSIIFSRSGHSLIT